MGDTSRAYGHISYINSYSLGLRSLNSTILNYQLGQFIIIRSTSTTTTFMIGEVVSWVSLTETLNVNITYVSEEGTLNDVNIHLSGIQGKSNTFLSYSTSQFIDLDGVYVNDNINFVFFSSQDSTYQNTTAYSPGQFLIITNRIDASIYLIVSVIIYNQTTGDLSVNVKYKTAGSGDLWNANLAGQNGTPGESYTYITEDTVAHTLNVNINEFDGVIRNEVSGSSSVVPFISVKRSPASFQLSQKFGSGGSPC
jgi:hypothetical protein